MLWIVGGLAERRGGTGPGCAGRQRGDSYNTMQR